MTELREMRIIGLSEDGAEPALVHANHADRRAIGCGIGEQAARALKRQLGKVLIDPKPTSANLCRRWFEYPSIAALSNRFTGFLRPVPEMVTDQTATEMRLSVPGVAGKDHKTGTFAQDNHEVSQSPSFDLQ